jgi:AAA domain
MDDTDHALFPRFSGELVATALKDKPVVMVTGPRQCGKTTLVRDLVAGNREFITMDDDTVLAAARGDPTGLYALSIERPLTKYSECPTFSGPSRSQSMKIAAPVGSY